MENLVSPSGSVKQTPIRKSFANSSQKDLWFICRQGSLADLDSALLLLKRTGGNINARNTFGLTPLHIATWRNHIPIVKRLLAAGADPNARDGESGWSSLHRALHFGHLAVASILLQAGASLTLEDSKCRTPTDLLSGSVSLAVGNAVDSVATEVFSWGSGTNYQLGTGNAHIQKLPCKVEALQDYCIKIISASKFHSVAVGSDGELYTWGFGRGGRLGHPDFDVHSGQAAVITPRLVTSGLGYRRVKIVAAAKHHTVIATDSGEVFTWGSNREGQLGYTSVDTQPTPRRVTSLKAKIIAVTAANKHSAAVSDSGEVYTWGCNKEGQLGYGTSNSASNSIPRIVEYLKGKCFKGVSAAKYHTVVLGADDEVLTWGHRLVTPRRVAVAKSTKKGGSTSLKFHRMERHVLSVAAGVTHSTALTSDGALFYWVSSDPDLRCQQLFSMCGRNIVSISAGKYWTAAVTNVGDVYMWDGKKHKDETPVVTRVHGVKRATSVCVGETHLLVLCALHHASYPLRTEASSLKPIREDTIETVEFDEDILFNDIQTNTSPQPIKNDEVVTRAIPSLKSLCEKVAAEFLVEPRNSLQLLEIADSLEAAELRKHCEEMTLRNLDYVFTVSASAIASASLEILARLEKTLSTRSSEPWSYRHLPTPTATFSAIINSDEEDSESENMRLKENDKSKLSKYRGPRVDSFLQTDSIIDQAIFKQVRALRKKLQQIEMLETKQLNGHHLDDQQIAKLQTRASLESALLELGFPLETESKLLPSGSSDGKGNKKADISRKQRRKSKQKSAQAEVLPISSEMTEELNSVKGFPDIKIQVLKNKEDNVVDADATSQHKIVEDSSILSPKAVSVCHNAKSTKSVSSKKKNRKGGLSMFLGGALDDIPKHTPPPLTPKVEGPAWGGVKFTHGHASLRDILKEQSKIKETVPIKSKDRSEDLVEPSSNGQILLSSFLPGLSSPIAVVSSRGLPTPEGERNTPPWSSAGTSPGLCRPSLRDIQMQQEKRHASISHSPKTRVSGFSVGSPSEAATPRDSVPSRWFKPEIETPSRIRSIQIEEKAMKDLKRFYSSVKLVKPEN